MRKLVESGRVDPARPVHEVELVVAEIVGKNNRPEEENATIATRLILVTWRFTLFAMHRRS